jgi:ATP-dependent DNA helicase RecG
LQKPIFEEFQNGFRVTVFNKSDTKNVFIKNDPVNYPVNDPVNDPVKERLKKIKAFIKENKYSTREELANKCGVSIETIKRDILKLKTNNEIKRYGSDKSGYWELI